jgi:hypothetical protein
MVDAHKNKNADSERLVLANDRHKRSKYREVLLARLARLGLDEDSYAIDEAMILLASIDVGADEVLISQQLGLSFDYVSGVGTRLRSGGVWIDHRVSHAERWDECLMMFMLDVLVAASDLDCANEHGQPNYRPKNRDALVMLVTILRPDHVRSHTATEIQGDLERHGVCLDTGMAQRWLREVYDLHSDFFAQAS